MLIRGLRVLLYYHDLPVEKLDILLLHVQQRLGEGNLQIEFDYEEKIYRNSKLKISAEYERNSNGKSAWQTSIGEYERNSNGKSIERKI